MKVFEACRAREEAEVELAISAAWLGARLRLVDPKKFPSLERLLGKNTAPKRQSPDEMLHAFRMMKAIVERKQDG